MFPEEQVCLLLQPSKLLLQLLISDFPKALTAGQHEFLDE